MFCKNPSMFVAVVPDSSVNRPSSVKMGVSNTDFIAGITASDGDTYTYNTYVNSSWKDQLTSYNGQSITYDASGNPTSYLGAALAWEGQRLKSYTPASTGS